MYTQMVFMETVLDFEAFAVKRSAWLRGLWAKGLKGAEQAAAGLPVA